MCTGLMDVQQSISAVPRPNDDGRQDQSSEESNHDDDEDVFDDDSYRRQVKEIQKKAISRFSELKFNE